MGSQTSAQRKNKGLTGTPRGCACLRQWGARLMTVHGLLWVSQIVKQLHGSTVDTEKILYFSESSISPSCSDIIL